MALDFPSSPTNGQTFVSGNRTWTYNTTTSSWEASSVATSKTANHVYAAPNGSAGIPDFRALVAADIPTLNQNTTGTAATITGVYSGTITSGQITTGLGFTPYNATNPSGYITGSGSITGSAGSLTGFTNSNSANPISGPDNLINNGLAYVTGMSLLGQTDGALYTQAYSTNWVHQIYGDYRTGQIALRAKNNGTWQAWRINLDSSNYTSYAMPSGSSATNSVDVRAPIFYDSNNTSFYLDPNGSSLLANITTTGRQTNAAGVKTYSITTVGQGNSNTTYEIMRISRDSANWSTNIPYEVTVYSAYYSSGGSTRWSITYGYGDTGTISCIDARGSTKHRVYLGTPVVVTGNISYIPVYVDLPNYYGVSIEVKYNTTEVSSFNNASQVMFTGTYAAGTGGLYSGDIHLVPNGGNVGIGTTNPTSLLNMYSATSTTLTMDGDAAVTLTLKRSSTNNIPPALILNKARGTTAARTAVASGDAMGGVRFQAFGGTTDRLISTITGVVDTYVSDSDISSYLTFATTPSAGFVTERLRISSSGSVTAYVDVRSPIFYDSDDTTYYVNPNSTSVMNAIQPWGEVGMRRGDSGTLLRSYNTSASQATQFYVNHNLAAVEIGNARGIVYAGGSYWQIANSARAPIFYDSDDTARYVDPNSTSQIGSTYVNGYFQIQYNSGNEFAGMAIRNNYGSASLQSTGFIDFTNENGIQKASIFGRIGTNGAGYLEFLSTVAGVSRSTDTRTTTAYAYPNQWSFPTAAGISTNIVYDRNDTVYYVDPNAGSNVFGEFKVNQNGAAGIQLISTTGTQSLWIRTGYDNAPTPSVSATNVQFQSSGSSGGSFTFWSGNTLALTITGDYAQGAGSLRAPIFYDSNNTAYYSDPSSTSRFSNFLLGGNEVYVYEGSTNVLNIRTGASPNHKYFGFGTDGRFTASNGGITATSDARATIFYDVDNTAYYLNPNGDSFLVGTTVITRNANSNDVFGGLELRENNLQGAATGAASEAPGLNFHWSNRGAARIYMNGAGNFVFAGQSDITNNRRDIIFASGYAATRVDAPIFYDSSNTAFYFDGASTTNINTMSGNSKTMFETADGYLRINQGSSFTNGIWTGSSNLLNSTGILGWGSNGGTTNSRVYINGGTFNGTNVIALDGSNGRITASDIRAPIFYDTDNTGFYINPNGDTNLNRTFSYLGGKDTNANWNTGFQNTPAASYNYHGDLNGGTNAPAAGWWVYESMRHSNASNYWGTQIAWGWEDNANRLQQRNVSNGSFGGWVEYLNTSDRTYNGNLYMTGSIRSTSSDIRAPIFYDQDNTGYYVNAAGTSYINALNIGPTAAGSSYLNINGYNAYGGTGYHGFLTVSNTYGSATNPNQYWRINGAGGFEIVNSPYNAVLFTFTQGGDFTAAGNVTAYSDRKLKANFEPIENALSKVTQLNGVTFTRIDKEDTTTRYAGLIAQDVEAVLPEAVQINETISYGEVKSVDYNATIALLVEAIKEQQSHITKLEEKLNKLLGE